MHIQQLMESRHGMRRVPLAQGQRWPIAADSAAHSPPSPSPASYVYLSADFDTNTHALAILIQGSGAVRYVAPPLMSGESEARCGDNTLGDKSSSLTSVVGCSGCPGPGSGLAPCASTTPSTPAPCCPPLTCSSTWPRVGVVQGTGVVACGSGDGKRTQNCSDEKHPQYCCSMGAGLQASRSRS